MQFKDIQLWGNYSHIGEKKKDSGQSLSTMEVIPSQSFASTTNLLVKEMTFATENQRTKSNLTKKKKKKSPEM